MLTGIVSIDSTALDTDRVNEATLVGWVFTPGDGITHIRGARPVVEAIKRLAANALSLAAALPSIADRLVVARQTVVHGDTFSIDAGTTDRTFHIVTRCRPHTLSAVSRT